MRHSPLPSRSHTRVAALGVIAALLAAPSYATASIGTGVGANPLTIGAAPHAGRTYTLRWLYVKNTGTANSYYVVRVLRLTPGSQRAVPARWVRLTPSAFRLGPGEIERVTVSLAIPAAAPGGRYLTNLLASTYAPHAPGTTALGAAAADQLAFQLPGGSPFPWPIVGVAAGIIAALAAILAIRRARAATVAPR